MPLNGTVPYTAKQPFQLVEDSPLANLMTAHKVLNAASQRAYLSGGAVYGTSDGKVMLSGTKYSPDMAREIALSILKLLGEDD